ncbi:MAG: hypothetical protein OEV79_12030 [candidate division WOR-3 bacterium]|nr:hypothetical protein [candidate division WOR-3 bacterium]
MRKGLYSDDVAMTATYTERQILWFAGEMREINPKMNCMLFAILADAILPCSAYIYYDMNHMVLGFYDGGVGHIRYFDINGELSQSECKNMLTINSYALGDLTPLIKAASDGHPGEYQHAKND